MAKTKALICAFVFAYAECWFSHAVAHFRLPEAINFPLQVCTIRIQSYMTEQFIPGVLNISLGSTIDLMSDDLFKRNSMF